MENEHVAAIRHCCKVMQEMALHSRTMSVGAKIVIESHCQKLLKELEIIELELMTRK